MSGIVVSSVRVQTSARTSDGNTRSMRCRRAAIAGCVVSRTRNRGRPRVSTTMRPTYSARIGQEHEQHAEQERHDRDGGRPSRNRVTVEPFAHDSIADAQESERRGQQAEQHRDPQRHERERADAVPREREHFAQIILARARMPLAAIERHACRGVPHPMHDAAEEQSFFLEFQNLVEHLPVEQPEIRRAGLDRRRRSRTRTTDSRARESCA